MDGSENESWNGVAQAPKGEARIDNIASRNFSMNGKQGLEKVTSPADILNGKQFIIYPPSEQVKT